jgi:GDP-L-fucose synthase
MTGPVEPTNEGYAIAKLAGYKMCSFYKKQYGIDSVSLMPCSLYGGNDHFDLEKGHVMAALVKRFTDAVDERRSEVTLWGTGSARREFMHVDDLARAVLFFMEKGESTEFINIGPGTDVSIKELALMIAAKTGFKGKINWDTSKPDGMPRKCLDVSEMLKAGFRPMISLDEGLDEMVAIYADIKKKSQFRKR